MSKDSDKKVDYQSAVAQLAEKDDLDRAEILEKINTANQLLGDTSLVKFDKNKLKFLALHALKNQSLDKSHYVAYVDNILQQHDKLHQVEAKGASLDRGLFSRMLQRVGIVKNEEAQAPKIYVPAYLRDAINQTMLTKAHEISKNPAKDSILNKVTALIQKLDESIITTPSWGQNKLEQDKIKLEALALHVEKKGQDNTKEDYELYNYYIKKIEKEQLQVVEDKGLSVEAESTYSPTRDQWKSLEREIAEKTKQLRSKGSSEGIGNDQVKQSQTLF